MLHSLNKTRPLYLLPKAPFAEDVLIPGFKLADKVDCMVGFFSSEVLASLAPGLASYIARSENSFRLVMSPFLRTEDQEAIRDGLKSAEEVANEALGELIITEDLLQQHTLKCLSWLLKKQRIKIKIALMKDALFHLKVWLFEEDKNILAAHGSSNATYSGMHKNIEQVTVSKSWQDSDQCYTTSELRDQFDCLWENKYEHCVVITLPHAVQNNLLQTYNSPTNPTEDDFRNLYDQALKPSKEKIYTSISMPIKKFSVPDSLQYTEGPFQHQGQAVTAWCQAGYRGILEMATGSGKTITSMISAYQLYKKHKPLLVIVAAPYVPLIEQWCQEITAFGLRPVNLTKSKNTMGWANELQKLKRKLTHGLSDIEVAVVSYRTLHKEKFLSSVKEFNCIRLLIADEVHNIATPPFIENPPEFFKYRLGLSATPVRQYDESGTDAIFKFFGSVVFKFTLEEAIRNCLVEYDYHLHRIDLTDNEMDEWIALTAKIKKNSWRARKDKSDEYFSKLLRDRRALLETASGKISMLKSLLRQEGIKNLRYVLIYTSDKEPKQHNAVMELLINEGIIFHQITEQETRDSNRMQNILKSFQDGKIQVLIAKRVLDEGVDIPQICEAFILASTTIKRQWVQRRGRLLRKCEAIKKTYSTIHDFLALPPTTEMDSNDEMRSIILSELERTREFAGLARNTGRPNGALNIINEMIESSLL